MTERQAGKMKNKEKIIDIINAPKTKVIVLSMLIAMTIAFICILPLLGGDK